MNLRFKHLGIAVPNVCSALESYRTLFGYRLLSGVFEDPDQEAVIAFVGSGKEGDIQIELVAPLTKSSLVARILANGHSAYHVCYGVDDIDSALAEFQRMDCIVVRGAVPAVAFGGRRIAWLYTPTRQLTELVESERNVESVPSCGGR